VIIEASAPANIAVIKYMGKVEGSSNVPTNSSLSLTLDDLCTFVRLELPEDKPLSQDEWRPLKKEGCLEPELSATAVDRFLRHFKALKQEWAIEKNFIIESCNNFPSDCGLASSASSFAALTLAAVEMFQRLNPREEITRAEIAQLSRQGSGSSCRSFFGPWALWYKEGVRPIEFPYVNLLHQVVIVAPGKKLVTSSQAHQRVVTSSLFINRAERAEQRLAEFMQAMHRERWSIAFEICWAEFWDMHALFETSRAPFGYMESATLETLNYIKNFWSQKKDGPLVTMDAGANVHLIWRADQEALALQVFQDLGKKYRFHANKPSLWQSAQETRA
jgi:diphosphomevalonate decarboxylase